MTTKYIGAEKFVNDRRKHNAFSTMGLLPYCAILRLIKGFIVCTKKSGLVILILSNGAYCIDEKLIEKKFDEKIVMADTRDSASPKIGEPSSFGQKKPVKNDLETENRNILLTIYYLEQLEENPHNPYNTYFYREALTTYNWLRRTHGLDTVSSLDNIDHQWLYDVRYETWKKRLGPTDVDKRKKLLFEILTDESYFQELKKESSSGSKEALFVYNYVRELYNLPGVLSLDLIDYSWVKEEDYIFWKNNKSKEMASVDELTQQMGLLGGIDFGLDVLREETNRPEFFRRRILYRYNYLRELCSMPHAESFNQIDHTWLFIKRVELRLSAWLDLAWEIALPLAICLVADRIYRANHD